MAAHAEGLRLERQARLADASVEGALQGIGKGAPSPGKSPGHAGAGSIAE
jgi:hypothetical protein